MSEKLLRELESIDLNIISFMMAFGSLTFMLCFSVYINLGLPK
jgi:hypothetical protein